MKNKKSKEPKKEKVLFITKFHWKTLLDAIICIVLPFLIIFTTNDRTTLTLALIILILALLLGVQRYSTRKVSEFTITNIRLIIKQGVFKSKSQEELLNRIEGVQLKQGRLGRMLNCGGIIIKDKGGAIYKLKDLEAPQEFYRILQEQINE